MPKQNKTKPLSETVIETLLHVIDLYGENDQQPNLPNGWTKEKLKKAITQTNPISEEWEKEFDEKFNLEGFCNYEKTDFRLNFVKASEIKQFIKSLLNKQRARDRGEIDRRCPKCGGDYIKRHSNDRDILYCKCVECEYKWEQKPLDTLKSYKLKKHGRNQTN